MKIIKVKLRCGTTGETYFVNRLVPVPQDAKLAKAKEALEDRLCAEAANEATAMNQHRRIRPDVQKLGWKTGGAR